MPMKLLKNINYDDVLFLDIETVRTHKELPKTGVMRESWLYKVRYDEDNDNLAEESYTEKASLYAEFSKVVCITMGKISNNSIALKSFTGKNEVEILKSFKMALEVIQSKNPSIRLCGHALLGFDIPFLCKRYMINRIGIPPLLDLSEDKPWTTTVLDTNVIWKGTGFSRASLVNIATALGLPSPKSEMDGSEVGDKYFNGELDAIKSYCEQDVVAVANVFRAMKYDLPLEGKVIKATVENKATILEKRAAGIELTEDEETSIIKQIDSLDGEDKKIAKEIYDGVTKNV